MISCQRELFDLPDDVAYLRCAASSPLLKSAVAAGQTGVAKKARPWRVGEREWTDEVEQLRALFAGLIDVSPDDIALVPSASFALSTAAANARLSPGDEIVVLAQQFPSHVYPWRERSRATGARLVTVPRPPSGNWTEGVLSAIGSRTAVVAVPQYHWIDGSSLDLVAIGEAARRAGADLALDLSQSVGAVPFSVRAVRPDYMVTVSEKWMLGPYQLAYFYVAPERQGGTPIEFTWSGRRGSEDTRRLVDYVDDYQPGARRFDGGERANFVTLPTAIAALRQIHAWGVPKIAATLKPMIADIADRATALGLVPTPAAGRAPHVIGLRNPRGLPDDLADGLAAAGVFVSIRGDAIRVAPHVYNHAGDIDALFGALKRLL